MNKNIFIAILMFVTINLFCQNIIETKSTIDPTLKTNYPINSEIKVYNMNSLNNKFHSETNQAGVFVNGIFVGDQSALNVINSNKIESVNIEDGNFEKNEKKYGKKILVKNLR